MRRTTDAVEILMADICNDSELLAMYENAGLQMEAGMIVYRLRESARLTQEELSLKVGQGGEWIDDLEMGDFDGDSLAALQTVARALGANVDAEIERIRAAHPKAGHELVNSVG